MRTAEQARKHNEERRGANSDYNLKRRGPRRRYTPTPEAGGPEWPSVFRDGRPLPSDLSEDSVITIFDGAGHATQFIDPTTRIVIEAVAPYRRLGFRIDPRDVEESEKDEVALEV